MYQAERRRERHAQADLIQAVAVGYGGCKSKEGGRAMEKVVKALRG
ncbi:MAG TPA: hypothetical protein VFJ01_06190 [Oleiagrimonas sp.]|nr:hypothetical protein [Oleiagrimonas sp.]